MIYIIVVGKLNEKFYNDAASEYLKRINAYAKVQIIEIKESRLRSESLKDIELSKSQEGREILNKVKGALIALDSTGAEITSVEFSNLIDRLLAKGDITFAIGGSYGLSEEVKERADFTLSFGRLTYPHQLMRVILSEQIYRAYTILNNTKYHK